MYNYLEALKEDIATWIQENKESIGRFDNVDVLKEELNEDLWDEDAVTGNGSDAGYPMELDEMREAVMDNAELLKDALEDFGTDAKIIAEKFLSNNWIYFDATIRLYLLSEAIEEVFSEHEEEYFEMFIEE